MRPCPAPQEARGEAEVWAVTLLLLCTCNPAREDFLEEAGLR